MNDWRGTKLTHIWEILIKNQCPDEACLYFCGESLAYVWLNLRVGAGLMCTSGTCICTSQRCRRYEFDWCAW